MTAPLAAPLRSRRLPRRGTTLGTDGAGGARRSPIMSPHSPVTPSVSMYTWFLKGSERRCNAWGSRICLRWPSPVQPMQGNGVCRGECLTRGAFGSGWKVRPGGRSPTIANPGGMPLVFLDRHESHERGIPHRTLFCRDRLGRCI